MRAPVVVALALVALSGAACTDSEDQPGAETAGTDPSPTVATLTAIPLPPPPPPTGRLIADIQQSSRDAAAHRFEVWVDNDTEAAITPVSVTYQDERFREPQVGTRLREIPSQARRGFQFAEPEQPVCGSTATSGTVTVVYRVEGSAEKKSMTVPVEDEADVVARVASSTCLEQGIARVALLRFDDDVPANGAGGEGSTATLTLVVEPTGVPGATLTIDSIAGNPVISPVGINGWQPNLTVTGTSPPQRVPLELKPTRCDGHAFGESGSLAAFAVNVHLDGEPGQIVLRLSPTGATNAITFAKASCGELTGL